MARLKARPLSLEEARRLYEIRCLAEGQSPKSTEVKNVAIGKFAAFIEHSLGVTPDIGHLIQQNVELFIIALQSARPHEHHPYIRSNKPLSRQTINCYVRMLRAFSHFLEEAEYTKDWALAKLKPPKTDDTIKPALDEEEVARMFAEYSPPNCYLRARNTALLAVALDCGLRAAELLGLKTRDIDTSRGCLYVFGKGRRERIVGISEMGLAALANYLRFRPETDNDLIFVEADGKPMTYSALSSLFARLKRKLGLPRLHAHLLRHASATMRLQAGEDLVTLQRQLGHSSIAVTQGYIGAVPWHQVREHQRTSPLNSVSIRLPGTRRRKKR